MSQTYYVLLECLAQDHMSFLATMEPQVFMYILSSITEGLTALGGNLNYFTGAFTQKLLCHHIIDRCRRYIWTFQGIVDIAPEHRQILRKPEK